MRKDGFGAAGLDRVVREAARAVLVLGDKINSAGYRKAWSLVFSHGEHTLRARDSLLQAPKDTIALF